MFFYWIIPILNTALTIVRYNLQNKEFVTSAFLTEFVITVLNPYLIGGIWLFFYSIWKGITLGKESQSSFLTSLDLEKLNMANYMKAVLLAWVIQTAYTIFSII